MSMSDFEFIIIGSGLSGLAFARFYLEIHPKSKLIIIEADNCIGGVWSSSRSYEEFWSQSGRRMTGFSDVPLTVPSDAPLFHDTFEAKYVTQYLEDYVDSHIYNGTSLRSRVLFNHRVQKVEKVGDFWEVHAEGSQVFSCPKLVVATGHTSVPNIPTIKGQDHFSGQVIHHKDFGVASKSVLANSECRNITVLGGGKSAVDMVYQSVKKGKNVSWIIRENGQGPALFFTASAVGRYRNSVESANTRYKACFSPSSFMPNFWLLRLFHWSNYGKNTMTERVQGVDQHCHTFAKYQTREGALSGFQGLQTTASAFWYTGPVGLAQHEDFWDTIAQNVKVYRKDVDSMKLNAIVMKDGAEIATDALLCGTGWKSNYSFFDSDLIHSLGLPRAAEIESEPEAMPWKDLLEAADKEVLANFPQLACPPPHRKPEEITTTAKLYKGILPLEDRSIVFLGHLDISNGFRSAEAQGVWTTAYFDGNVKLPHLTQMQKEVAYMNAFSRRRYPSHGQKGDCIFFELVWYTDDLLASAGLRSHRKGLWSDWIEPCLQVDFEGVVEEYRHQHGF